MLYSNTTKQYAAYVTAHQTVNKTRQVVMLYDGAIRFMAQAKEAIEKGDIQTRFNTLTKASAIVNGLQSALDFNQGGSIARLLDDYYFSIDMRIMAIHQTNDATMCDHIIKELKMMRDAWQEVDETTSESAETAGAMPKAFPASPAENVTGMQVSI